MAVSGAGKFRVLLQRYQYQSHNIFCIIKILPEKVEIFEKEPHNDFDWMTSNRWAKIENALNRLFASFKNWSDDTRKLKLQMLVDHIKVSIATSEDLLPAARKLLAEDVQPKNELSLEIILSYMSHEDTTISDKLGLGKYVQKGNSSTAEDGSDKIKNNTSDSTISNKMKSGSRGRNDHHRLHTNDDYPNRESSNRKNRRRSLSQNSQSTKEVSPGAKAKLNSSSEHAENLSKSPSSRTSSAESKAGRRSARFPVIPTRYKEFILSDKGHRKRKQILHCDASTEKESSSKPTESTTLTGIDSQDSRVNKLEGAQRNIDVFQELDKLLTTPKPRKVRIILLEDMDEAAVMKTFESYKSDFDRLFKERRHKDYTNNYMSIDHSHIMDILNKTIRDSMLKKLADVYCKSSPNGSLVINGLLPLWIIRLFMDKFELTQLEAVNQISDQLHYHTYLKAINNEGLEDY